MNIIDALQLYCHILQRNGGGIDGRHRAREALIADKIHPIICDAISKSVSNDGHLSSGNGGTFLLTQLST